MRPGAVSTVIGATESRERVPDVRSSNGLPKGARVVPIEGVAARLVIRMEESRTVPTATSMRDIPVTVLEAERARLNRVLAPRRLSYTHLIAYALAQAVAVHPGMAANFQEIDGRAHRVEPARIGLGIAVDTRLHDGTPFLVVPVIAGVDDLGFTEFIAAYDDLVERARSGRLAADDLAGGTIMLTNPGTFGTSASVPRLLAGQGTIVATGAIRRAGGEPVMTFSSTYDHRVIQGAESGRFLRTLDELLQGVDSFYEYLTADLGVPYLSPARSDTTAPTEAASLAPAPITAPQALDQPPPADVASAMALVRSYRQFGHRAAHLDPLGAEPPGDPSLDPATWGLTSDALARVPAGVLGVYVPGDTLADVLPELQRTYCGTSAFEVEHIASHEERDWLRRAIESRAYRSGLGVEAKRRLLHRLTAVEALERFLQRAYLGQKRFSIEGLDVLVPMLDQLIELVAASGTQLVEIGMPTGAASTSSPTSWAWPTRRSWPTSSAAGPRPRRRFRGRARPATSGTTAAPRASTRRLAVRSGCASRPTRATSRRSIP